MATRRRPEDRLRFHVCENITEYKSPGPDWGWLRGTRQGPIRLPELRRRLVALAGQVRRLRRVEHARRGGAGGRRRRRAAARKRGKGRIVALASLAGETAEAPRVKTGIAEFDRVTGGGFVRGSTLLVGGDPGIGKSTLLLQAAGALAQPGRPVVYISGEEAVAQIRLRAERLGLAARAGEARRRDQRRGHPRHARRRAAAGPRHRRFDPDAVDRRSPIPRPGTVTQVRASAQALIRYAKQTGAAVVFVGHVTKDGQIAGPRVVEHMVDARALFRGRRRPPLPHPPRRQEPLRADRRDRRLRDDRRAASARSPTRPSCSSASAAPRRPAPRSSPAWRGPGRCSSRSRRWSRRPPSARRAARSSAGTRAASPWCWPCSRPIAASASAIATSISTSPAASASPSRRPTSPSPRRWSRRGWDRALPARLASISARSACRARSGRSPTRRRASRRRSKLGFSRMVAAGGLARQGRHWGGRRERRRAARRPGGDGRRPPSTRLALVAD